jgi:hypothetical protein
MPVRTFRSVEEMPPPETFEPGDPRLLAQIKALFEASRRLAPTSRVPGVVKHRSIEELNRQTEAWEREAARRRRRS